MWEVFVLTFLIVLGFGVAIFMVRKTKRAAVTIVQNHTSNIDLEELAIRVAKAVAKEVAEEVVKNLPKGMRYGAEDVGLGPVMDESIIPIAIETAVAETSLEGMAKEETAVDKDFEKSKSKLGGILKKRKGKDG